MEVYALEVYGERGQMLRRRFAECATREEAETQAEEDCMAIGGAYWEVHGIQMGNEKISPKRKMI